MTTKERNILKALKMMIQLRLDGKAYDIDTILDKYPVDKAELMKARYAAVTDLYEVVESKDIDGQMKEFEKSYSHHVIYGRKRQ